MRGTRGRPASTRLGVCKGRGHEKVQPPKKGESMKYNKGIAVLAVAVLCFAASAFAQSSGSFSYGTGNNFTGTTGCMLVSNSGDISGGQQCSQSSLDSSSFTCSTNADCTAIFGSNSGATCNLNIATGISSCALPPAAGDCIGH